MTKKRIVLSVISSLFAASVLTVFCSTLYIQNEFEKSLYDNVIRFHVIANSDSDYDQNAKLLIKDELLSHISTITKDSNSADEAYVVLANNLDYVKHLAESTVSDLGFEYDIDVSLSNEEYPVRFYDGFALPSGSYKSLIITLGRAQGKNWWCVVYPSVCESPSSEFDSLMVGAGVSEEAVDFLKDEDGRSIKLYLFELFKQIIKGEDNGIQNFR